MATRRGRRRRGGNPLRKTPEYLEFNRLRSLRGAGKISVEEYQARCQELLQVMRQQPGPTDTG